MCFPGNRGGVALRSARQEPVSTRQRRGDDGSEASCYQKAAQAQRWLLLASHFCMASQKSKRLVIIGGGVSGLAAAHRVIEIAGKRNQPIHLTLLEAGTRLGGIIQTHQRDGFLVESGPDSFISEKPEAIDLAHRLEINSQLIQTNSRNRRSFILRGGRLRPVPEGFQLLAPSRMWPFLTTDIFSASGKLRMGMDLLLSRRKTNGLEFDDESLASFVRRRLGNEALERMAQPMVGGIYTADPEKLSLRATLPRFLDMEREHRSIILAMLRRRRHSRKEASGVSGARYSLFLSFAGGMQVLTDSLREKLCSDISAYKPCESAAPVEIRLNSKVKSVNFKAEPDGATRWEVVLDQGETIRADAVCLAVSSFVAAKLIEGTDFPLAVRLRQIRYASTATVNLAYRREGIAHPLDGFGFVVPYIEKRSLIACTFSSVKFAGRAPEGKVLLRAFVGGDLQPDMFALDEPEMVKRVKGDLTELLAIKEQPLFADVTKWRDSMPQYQIGHLTRISQIEDEVDKLPGLALAGSAYRGAGIPDCIRSGEIAAERLLMLAPEGGTHDTTRSNRY